VPPFTSFLLRSILRYSPKCLVEEFCELRLYGVLGSSLPAPTFFMGDVFLCPPECINLAQHKKSEWEEAEKPVPSDGCLKGRVEPVAQPASSSYVRGGPVLFWGKRERR
jgi:hypothetical protein